MNLSWKRFIINSVLKYKKKTPEQETELSAYEIAKAYRELKISVKSFFSKEAKGGAMAESCSVTCLSWGFRKVRSTR